MIVKKTKTTLTAIVSCAFLFAACGGEQEVEELMNLDVSSQSLDVTGEACEAAMNDYMSAIGASEVYLAFSSGDYVGEEDEMGPVSLLDVANLASLAVTACPQIRDGIKSSPCAEAIREALGASLTLRSLTGELLVIKDSPWQNWSGVDRFFEDGLTFIARPDGSFGSAVRIDFAADGQAKWSGLNYNLETGDIHWAESNATYMVQKPDGERGNRIVRVNVQGNIASFRLSVQDAVQWSDASKIVLQPLNDYDEVADDSGWTYWEEQDVMSPRLYSLIDAWIPSSDFSFAPDFNRREQSIGFLTDGLTLNDIIIEDNGKSQSMVFDVDGDYAPYTAVRYVDRITAMDASYIEVAISGVRFDETGNRPLVSECGMPLGERVRVNAHPITGYAKDLVLDDSMVVYRIYVARQSTFRLFSNGAGNIVVEVEDPLQRIKPLHPAPFNPNDIDWSNLLNTLRPRG